ncbi:hypothetical protein LTS18_003045 [Coniosporium uncinatum]|uniref:Uncharacterized protein n=1 Tax=Coniosporium uncinatum TaxID=93489 RepID=A0ACC3DBM9_9PEZI|nr:hypothetical protein LTS18_003045 [Coniosporium uncinatum]
MAKFSIQGIESRDVVVIGSGTLGRRVVLVWASQGGSVRLVDSNEQAVKEALTWVEVNLPGRVKAVKGTEGKVTIESSTQKAIKNAWMVVECIPEIQKAKIDLLGQLDQWCPEDTIIAAISSSYNSADLVEKVTEKGRARVVNTHYFQPPELPPVDIMSSGSTNPAIIKLLVAS